MNSSPNIADNLKVKYDFKYNNNTVDNKDIQIIEQYDHNIVNNQIINIENQFNINKEYLNKLNNNLESDTDYTELIENKIIGQKNQIEVNLSKLESLNTSIQQVNQEIEEKELLLIKNNQNLNLLVDSPETKQIINNIKQIKKRIEELKIFFS